MCSIPEPSPRKVMWILSVLYAVQIGVYIYMAVG